MEVSKFKIGKNIIDVKDAQARDDVIAAMNAAQDAQSTADGAISDLVNKQNVLSKLTNFTGNIDTLYATSLDTIQNNGVYFCQTNTVTGALPFTSDVYFFTLIVLRNIQIAIPYVTPADSAVDMTVKVRDITNGWRLWRGAKFTV